MHAGRTTGTSIVPARAGIGALSHRLPAPAFYPISFFRSAAISEPD